MNNPNTAAVDAEAPQRLSQWIERHLDAKVLEVKPQPRWRRGWYVTARRGAQTLNLYVRGERDSRFNSLPFEIEARFHDVLEAHGIPVPHVYGVCPEPHAIVMDLVPGSRDITGLSAQAQTRIGEEYAELLARIHSIDPQEFQRVGLWRAASPEEASRTMMAQYEQSYLQHLKVRPEPFVEFVRLWLQRNVPRNRQRMSFVTCDPGQFLVHEGRIVALHDFEMGYIGDPLADLAPLRGRGAFEPMGDLARVFRRYSELSGVELDPQVLNYYLVWWGLTGAMWIVRMLAEPTVDHLRSLFSQISGPGFAMQAMAEFMQIDLDKVSRPAVHHTRRHVTLLSLEQLLQGMQPTDDVQSYRLQAARGIAQHLAIADGLDAELERDDRDEVAELLGKRPPSWQDAEEALERFVQQAGPERDADILRFFDRRRQRQKFLLPFFERAPTPGDIAGSVDKLQLEPLSSLLRR